ncbi:hypothetical protein [Teredinibacter turnerae]|uniref:hypothetical protein n=1 Tax=Teredinibacter turnerae TaxID=2426 RepID=UPI0005F87DF0|nr:hypothetical protein [Teredinibacter turnerae]
MSIYRDKNTRASTFAGTLIAFGLLVSAFTCGAECLVSTNPPKRLLQLPHITNSHHSAEHGFIHIALDNSDQILASYGTCELSLHAIYLLTKNAQVKTTLITLLKGVVPAEADLAQLESQLRKVEHIVPGEPITLDGVNSSHTVTLYHSTSPLFEFEWHYQWNSPAI